MTYTSLTDYLAQSDAAKDPAFAVYIAARKRVERALLAGDPGAISAARIECEAAYQAVCDDAA
jgi:hypothetical protein